MLSWQELLLKANMEELRCAMPRLQKEPQAQVMSSFFTVVFTSYHKPLPSGAEDVVQLAEYLPGVREALGRISSTT